ncbi:MAG TPA: YMGG-like glycine zipper-containing protein [Pyrinomonadaceae bacterium]
MKKGLVSIFCLLVLTLTALPMEVGAQTRYRRRFDNSRRYEQRVRDYRYQDRVYTGPRSGRWNRWDRDRSFWDRHRDKLTTAIGAGAGAAVGAAAGGKKGAIIGAIVGGAGSAIYTYGIRDKNRRRY